MAKKKNLTAQRKYKLLLQISQQTRDTFDLVQILNILLDEVKTLVEYDAAGIFVLNQDALLELAAGSDMELASEAAARLSGALELARKHMPVGVANIKYELFRAEHTVAQLRGAPPRDADRPREIEEAA